MSKTLSRLMAAAAMVLFSIGSARAAMTRLHTTVPQRAAALRRLGHLASTNRLQLAIALPLRSQGALTNLAQQIYTPDSPYFHRYLTPEQFAEKFGPTEEDYQRVIAFAKSNRLEILSLYGNRSVVDVVGSVDDIESAFHVRLYTYQHPTENRQFYAPDVEPTVDASLAITNVVGLDNYTIPKPRASTTVAADGLGQTSDASGTGTNGWFLGSDFRNAYANGMSQTGAGQIVALFELDGYNDTDILKYEHLAGLKGVPLQNVLLPGADGSPNMNNNQNIEVDLDIEMVMAMAPGLQKILVVQAPVTDQGVLDVMNQLAYPSNGVPLANQISSSWGASEGSSYEPQLIEMAVQGQSFFFASGDNGAPTNGVQTSNVDDNYMTMVGGTELNMNGAGSSWKSEQVWNDQFIQGRSTGYIDTALAIPDYQKGINVTANGGSSVHRNVPDVAMCADYIEVIGTEYFTNGSGFFSNNLVLHVGGTSAAAPLWAAYTALINEQEAQQGESPVGFLNPALYSIAEGPSYASCFHDVTSGNNTNTFSAGLFKSGAGYDNCTGLGSPNGINLLNALVPLSGPVFVDFNYIGSGTGAFYTPFNTLAQGVKAVANGSAIFIERAGTSSETMTITKSMTITAEDGAATIGN